MKGAIRPRKALLERDLSSSIPFIYREISSFGLDIIIILLYSYILLGEEHDTGTSRAYIKRLPIYACSFDVTEMFTPQQQKNSLAKGIQDESLARLKLQEAKGL